MAHLFRVALFLLLTTAAVHGAGAFEYVNVESVQDGPTVTVENFDAFVHLAETNDVQTILVPSESSSLSSRFMFALDGVVYSTDASEYKTIKDYSDGHDAGFEHGKDFYHARELGIESFARYSRFVDGWFLSVEDMEDAYASGFGDATFDSLPLLFPRRVNESEFERIVLPILVRITMQDELFSEYDEPFDLSLEDLYRPGDSESIPEWATQRSATVERSTRGQAADISPLEIDVPNPPYFGSELYATVEEATASVLRQIDAPDSTRRGYSAKRIAYGHNDGRYEIGRAIVADWNLNAAGVYFYLARLHGYDNFQAFSAEYDELRQALERGFFNLADAESAEKKGFRSASEYYTAQERGFDNHLDYDFARRLGVESEEYYDRYKSIISSLRDIRKQTSGEPGTSSLPYREALILYMFERIPDGRVVSIGAVLSRTEQYLENYPALQNLDNGLSRLQQSWLEKFVEEHTEAIEGLGDLRLEDGVFSGG